MTFVNTEEVEHNFPDRTQVKTFWWVLFWDGPTRVYWDNYKARGRGWNETVVAENESSSCGLQALGVPDCCTASHRCGQNRVRAQTTQPLCSRHLSSHLSFAQTGCSAINPLGKFLQVVLRVVQPRSRDSEGFEWAEFFQTQQGYSLWVQTLDP